MRRAWWGCGLALWLRFEALLRPGELCRLFRKDLSFPDAVATGQIEAGLVALVRRPKTRRVWREQFILVKSGPLILWMNWWCQSLRRGEKLFPLSYHSLGSLRAGGATEHFRCHQDLAQLQYHGRWHSVDSLRSYLHLAMAVHVAAQAPQGAVEKLTAVHRFRHKLPSGGQEVTAVLVMSNCLSLAILELAAALEAIGVDTPWLWWKGPPRRPARIPCLLPGVLSRTRGHKPRRWLAYCKDVRRYLVLSNAAAPDRIGLYVGPAATTWRVVEMTLAGSASPDPSGERSGGNEAVDGSPRSEANASLLPVSTPTAISGAAAEVAGAVRRAAEKMGSADVDQGRTAADFCRSRLLGRRPADGEQAQSIADSPHCLLGF